MKKEKMHIAIGAIIVLIISQIYYVSRFNKLERVIEDLTFQLCNTEQNINSNINDIYYNVDEILKEEASILSSVNVDIGELDVEKLSIPVKFSVQPKVVSDTTIVYLKFEDETIKLEKNDIEYIGQKVFEISSNDIQPIVIVEDKGIKNISEDNRLTVPIKIEEFIPMIYPFGYGGGWSHTSGSDKYEYREEGFLPINIEERNNIGFKTIKYVTYIGDEKVNERNVTKHDMNNQGLELNKSYTLKEGQVLTSHIIAVDELGFTHEYPLVYYVAGSDDEKVLQKEAVKITSPNGKVVIDTTWDNYEEIYYEHIYY